MEKISFYDWLLGKNWVPPHGGVIYSRKIIGYSDLPLGIENEPLKVDRAETMKLMQMEKYVNTFMEVTDNEFNEMLQNKHMKNYQKLAAEYVAVDGGIASDLRNDGWRAVAEYIAYNRNIEKRRAKLKSCKIDAAINPIKSKHIPTQGK